MPWYVYVFLGVLVNAAATVLRKLVLSGRTRLDYYESAFLLSVTTFVVLLGYVAFVGFYMPPFHLFWWVFIINMTLGVVGLLTNQKGLSLLDVGEYTVLMTFSQVVAWVTSVIWMGIGLSFYQGLGSVLILGSICVLFVSRAAFRRNSTAGLVWTSLTALNYGVAVLTDQVVYRYSDPASFMVIGFGLTAVILYALRPRVAKTLRLLRTDRLGARLLLLGLVSGMSLVLLFTSLKMVDNAPLFNGLSQIGIVVGVITGVAFLKERTGIPRKLAAAAIATCGAVLMVL